MSCISNRYMLRGGCWKTVGGKDFISDLSSYSMTAHTHTLGLCINSALEEMHFLKFTVISYRECALLEMEYLSVSSMPGFKYFSFSGRI